VSYEALAYKKILQKKLDHPEIAAEYLTDRTSFSLACATSWKHKPA
jgi:hypothetical protein